MAYRQQETEQADRESDNADAVHGMPVSLQLVANRLEEEKVVAMTRAVLEGLGAAV